jgi:hypothetical protein
MGSGGRSAQCSSGPIGWKAPLVRPTGLGHNGCRNSLRRGRGCPTVSQTPATDALRPTSFPCERVSLAPQGPRRARPWTWTPPTADPVARRGPLPAHPGRARPPPPCPFLGAPKEGAGSRMESPGKRPWPWPAREGGRCSWVGINCWVHGKGVVHRRNGHSRTGPLSRVSSPVCRVSGRGGWTGALQRPGRHVTAWAAG